MAVTKRCGTVQAYGGEGITCMYTLLTKLWLLLTHLRNNNPNCFQFKFGSNYFGGEDMKK